MNNKCVYKLHYTCIDNSTIAAIINNPFQSVVLKNRSHIMLDQLPLDTQNINSNFFPGLQFVLFSNSTYWLCLNVDINDYLENKLKFKKNSEWVKQN